MYTYESGSFSRSFVFDSVTPWTRVYLGRVEFLFICIMFWPYLWPMGSQFPNQRLNPGYKVLNSNH